jgi:hypothetical protein
MDNQELDKLLNDLSAKRQKLQERLERTQKELEAIEQHINAVQKESTERLLQDDRVDSGLIEQVFALDEHDSDRNQSQES